MGQAPNQPEPGGEPRTPTTILFQQFVAGDDQSLAEILLRYNRRPVAYAETYISRLKLYDPADGAEDAVS